MDGTKRLSHQVRPEEKDRETEKAGWHRSKQEDHGFPEYQKLIKVWNNHPAASTLVSLSQSCSITRKANHHAPPS